METRAKKSKSTATSPVAASLLSSEDVRTLVSSFTVDEMRAILIDASSYPPVVKAICAAANQDARLSKVTIFGLAEKTTFLAMGSHFTSFGDPVAGWKRTGFTTGCVAFANVESAVLATKEPEKLIDGVLTVAVRAFSPVIFLHDVPVELDLAAIRSHFSASGEIVAAVKFERHYAIILFRSPAAVEASLKNTIHQIGDHKILCQDTNPYLDQKLPTPSQTGLASSSSSGLQPRPSPKELGCVSSVESHSSSS